MLPSICSAAPSATPAICVRKVAGSAFCSAASSGTSLSPSPLSVMVKVMDLTVTPIEAACCKSGSTANNCSVALPATAARAKLPRSAPETERLSILIAWPALSQLAVNS